MDQYQAARLPYIFKLGVVDVYIPFDSRNSKAGQLRYQLALQLSDLRFNAARDFVVVFKLNLSDIDSY